MMKEEAGAGETAEEAMSSYCKNLSGLCDLGLFVYDKFIIRDYLTIQFFPLNLVTQIWSVVFLFLI